MFMELEDVKPDRETEQGQEARMWGKGLPIVDGDYYSRLDEFDKSPTPIRIERGKVYEFGCQVDVRREHEAEEWEYFGPVSAEQLTSLRAAALAALEWIVKFKTLDHGAFHVANQGFEFQKCNERTCQKATALVAQLEAALNPQSQDNKGSK